MHACPTVDYTSRKSLACHVMCRFLYQNLIVWTSLVSNSRSSCVSLLSVEVTGMHHHVWPHRPSVISFVLSPDSSSYSESLTFEFLGKARFFPFFLFSSIFRFPLFPSLGAGPSRLQSPGGSERGCTAMLLSLEVGCWQPNVPSSASCLWYTRCAASSCSLVAYFVILFV